MKTRYIYYPLLMLLAILLPTSCSVDDDIDVNPNTVGEKVRFNIGVSLAGTSDVESRAFGHETYNSIRAAISGPVTKCIVSDDILLL